MDVKKLYRSRTDKLVAGVCGGLGQYLGIDPTLLRLLFALLVVFGIGSGVLVYLILMIVVPLEPDTLAGPVAPPEETPKDETN